MEKIQIFQTGETTKEEDEIIKQLIKELPHHYGKVLTFSTTPVMEIAITFVLGSITSGITYDMIKHIIQKLINHPIITQNNQNKRRNTVAVVEKKEKQVFITNESIIFSETTEKTITCDSIDEAFQLLQTPTKPDSPQA